MHSPIASSCSCPATGTFVASYLARYHRSRVEACMLIDPVCIGMFLPNLVSNFLYHKPRLAGWNMRA
jgi:hypothetical protein